MVTEALEEPSSRRQLLTRLAGLGLVAAGGLALLPEDAEAKPKQRAPRRAKQRKSGRAKPAQARRGGRLSAQKRVVDHRSPVLKPVTQLQIVSIGGGMVQVTISGTLTFEDTHLWYMRRGTRYSLTAELGDDDDWTTTAGDEGLLRNNDDYCNSIWVPGKGLQRLVWPTNPANPAQKVSVFFRQNMPQSFLDRDPVGKTEVYGLLVSWRDSGTGWVRLGQWSTNNYISRVF
jgi:hypothetical protein